MNLIIGYFIGLFAAIIFGVMFVFYDSLFVFATLPEEILLAGVIVGFVIAIISATRLCTGITGRIRKFAAIMIGLIIPAMFILGLAYAVYEGVDFVFQDLGQLSNMLPGI